MYDSINWVLGSSSVAQSTGTDEMPGSIHSGERSARAVYMGGDGNWGPVRVGCSGSAPLPSGTRDPMRAVIVLFGSMRASNCVLTEARGELPPPPSGGS